MGLAIDTAVFTVTNPGSGGAAATINAGDIAGVRSFNPPSTAVLDFVTRMGATEGFVSIRSPRFHDPVRGFQVITSETPAVLLMPRETGQPVYSADVFTIQVSGGSAEVDGGAFGVYYTDLGGANSKYLNWSDISSSVRNLAPIEVDVAAQATAGAWTDTVITTTENLLKADTYYAVLGYLVDTACIAVGIRSPETANYRCCGPGPTQSFPTDDYFIRMNQRQGRPYIPVFNANNRAGIYVSTSTISTSATPKVQLICAELAGTF